MKLTGAFTLTAAVNPEARRIVGQIVPFGERGNPGLAGSGIQLEVEAGGLLWADDKMPVLRSTHHTEPVGRAVTLDQSGTGIVAAFKVANTTAGTDALTLAAEGLQTGLSIEAEAPDTLTADADGVYRLTAANPATLTAVALVESPAFQSAQVHQVAAKKEETMSDKVEAAEVPDEDLSSLVSSLTDAIGILSTALGSSADPTAEPEDGVEAAKTLPQRLTAATSVTKEPFPYGHPGAEGQSFFRDLWASKAQGDSRAAIRAEKAQTMLNATRNLGGRQLTAANEPTVRSTLVIPNVYDAQRYVDELVSPRVIADHVPGVQVDAPNPVVIPAFSSSAGDGASGEPVVVQASEGSNPAQAEIATTTITMTPLLYNGLYDVSRQALDAATPTTDALILTTLINSYRETTEAAAVTAILANGTAGTDSATGTANAQANNALATMIVEAAAMNVARFAPPDAFLLASDVYTEAVAGTNATSGDPLYKFRPYNTVNTNAGMVDSMELEVVGRPAYLSHKLTATKLVAVKWSDVLRLESATQTFTFEQPAGPAAVRFALAGYFVQRTLRASGVRYWAQA